MIRIALMVIATVGSTLLVTDAVDREKTSPAATEIREKALPASDPEPRETGMDRLSGSLRFVGICSVLCSLIGGTVLVVVTRRRKGGSPCNG